MRVITFTQGLRPEQLIPLRQSAARYSAPLTVISPDAAGADVWRCDPVETGDGFYSKRWEWYSAWMTANPDEENVIICDGGDVVFNDDPNRLIFKKFNASEESRALGTCYINSEWLARAYADRITDSIKPYNIVCAGVAWGKRDWLLKWCEFVGLHYEATPTMDQGILNYAARAEAFPVKVHPNGLYVLTGCLVPDERVRVVNGVMFMHDVCRPVIVHQWNRVPKLKEFVQKEYHA